MSHYVETMAYNRVEKPWHGLGNAVDPSMSLEEWQRAAGLDWTVFILTSPYYTWAQYFRHPARKASKILRRNNQIRPLLYEGPPEYCEFCSGFTDSAYGDPNEDKDAENESEVPHVS